MYYYIMEPAGGKAAAWQERVKTILGDLGIAGETVTPSPARTIEELASLGVVKGYSTIVAVGSEKLVNKIVTTIINQKESQEIVLGIIPDNYESSLAKKIKVKDLKDACETLKYRKLETISACFIEPNKYFLTEAILESNRPVDAYITTPFVKAGLPFNKITIRPGLKMYISDNSTQSSKGGIFSFLFGKNKQSSDINSSFFHTKRLKIETLDQTMPVKVDDEVISKTPIVCENRPKALKIIVARDIMELNK
jgi:diacylglycerol kinase family enzyme